MADEALFINGVDGSSGGYLLPSMTIREAAEAARGDTIDPRHFHDLQYKAAKLGPMEMAPLKHLDPRELAEVGWGVIFAHGADPAIRDALGPLLDHRRAQASRLAAHHYKEFLGPQREPYSPSAYRPGETALDFLERHGSAPGPVDPDCMPFYLLIVGDPRSIPFGFQYQLDVQHAVGRIAFDTIEEYARYARSVVEAETNPPPLPRRLAFFATENPDDPATNQSADLLVRPLAAKVAGLAGGWQVRDIVGEGATKARLRDVLGGPETPAFLFTASHGLGFPSGHPRQMADQGALVCQDWAGPVRSRGPIPEAHYFAGRDLGDDARVHGLLAFHFACYGAGTPDVGDFPRSGQVAWPSLAPHPFVAGLPRRMLGHLRGGALAVIGHVDLAWPCSFVWGRARPERAPHLQVFQDLIGQLLEGHPIGSALDSFNTRYAEISSGLNQAIEAARRRGPASPNAPAQGPGELTLARLWTANNDARGYVILGDPAVRLNAGSS